MHKKNHAWIVFVCIALSGHITASERSYGFSLGINDNSRIKRENNIYELLLDTSFRTAEHFPFKYLPNNYWSPEIGIFTISSRGTRIALVYSQWNAVIGYKGYGSSAAGNANYLRQSKLKTIWNAPLFNILSKKIDLYLTVGTGLIRSKVVAGVPGNGPIARFKPALSGNIGLGLRYFYSRSNSIESSLVYNVGKLKNEYSRLVETDISLDGIILDISISFYLIKPK